MEVVTIVISFAFFAVASAANGLSRADDSVLPHAMPHIEGDFNMPVFDSKFHDTVAKYTPCERDDSKCESFSMETYQPQKHESPDEIKESSCQKFLENLQRLHHEQPRVKDLRYQMLAYFDSAYATGVVDPDIRKNILLNNINVLLEALQNLKYDLEVQCTDSPPDITMSSVEEMIAEEVTAEEVEHPYPIIGSVRGIPGIHYPNYTEVPVTSFSCNDKEYIPGFYADLETRCQVFHVCYEHRRESFLCPIGTVFNQPILACDYWYSSNCSLAPHYFDVNIEKDTKIPEGAKDDIEEIITTIIEQEKPNAPPVVVKDKIHVVEAELDQIFKFLPVKAKVVEFPKPKPAVVDSLPIVEPIFAVPPTPVAVPKLVAEIKSAIADITKAKIAAKVAEKSKVKIATAAAATIPVAKLKVATKAKVKVAMASAVPVAKAAAVPLFKAKVAAKIPLVKAAIAVDTKIAAKKVPIVKAAVAAKKVPIMKAVLAADAKMIAAVKAKKAIAPLKSKLMISPLTKKALALGYLKLLKAKKLALMG